MGRGGGEDEVGGGNEHQLEERDVDMNGGRERSKEQEREEGEEAIAASRDRLEAVAPMKGTISVKKELDLSRRKSASPGELNAFVFIDGGVYLGYDVM